MKKINKIIDSFEEIVVMICLAIMTILSFSNVVTRYIFNFSMNFAEEVISYLFVLVSLLGASIAAKRGAHLGFTLLVDNMPKIVARLMGIISALGGVVFSGIIFYYGVLMTMSQFSRGQLSLGAQVPEWIYGSFVPIGAFFVTIRFIQILIHAVRGEEAAREDVLADAMEAAKEEVG